MTVSDMAWRGASLVVILTAALGCETSVKPTSVDAKSAADSHDDHDHSQHGSHADAHDHSDGGESGGVAGHQHGAGPHQGTLADWGGGKYHVEFTVDHDQQQAVVYVLGGDEKTPTPVRAAEGKLLLTINEPAFLVELLAAPLEGESADHASRFVGKHVELGVVREFAGTISGEVDGTPFAGDFQETAHGDHGEHDERRDSTTDLSPAPPK